MSHHQSKEQRTCPVRKHKIQKNCNIFKQIQINTKTRQWASHYELEQSSDLISVQAPELEFLLEERSADVGRVVQLASAVVVEDLCEDAWMSVEEIFVEDRVVVGQRFRQPRQPSGRNLLQRRLLCSFISLFASFYGYFNTSGSTFVFELTWQLTNIEGRQVHAGLSSCVLLAEVSGYYSSVTRAICIFMTLEHRPQVGSPSEPKSSFWLKENYFERQSIEY